MPPLPETSYDDVPYHSRPIYPTHPDCIATVGALMGVPVVPPSRCRVLEIGCAAGGNLLPMALALPNSEFVGLDLSTRQIAEGEETRRTLGIENARLLAMSLTDIDASFGQFDYILCHGVFSWVPRPVQERILEICRANLSPRGIAYVSYNTYPGWHWKTTLRDLMLAHASRFEDPAIRLQQARTILQFFVQATKQQEEPIYRHFHDEIKGLANLPDHYVFHEYLETDNHPCYFTEFMARAHKHGLQYVGDAWVHLVLEALAPEVRDSLVGISEDLIQLQQFHDFLTNCSFRRTLLCHATFELDRSPSFEVIRGLHAGALARPMSAEPDLYSTKPETFEIRQGGRGTTDSPLAKTMLACLHRAYPGTIAFDDLWAEVCGLLAEHGALTPQLERQGPALAAEYLVQAYMTRFVSLHQQAFPMTLRPGDRPRGFRLARLQVAQGRSEVTTMRHTLARLTDLDRVVLAELDGSRTRGELVERLLDRAVAGEINLRKDDKVVTDRETLRPALTDVLEQEIHRLAGFCILEA